jgi:hypothetical protein
VECRRPGHPPIIESIISAIFDIFQFLFGPPPIPQAAPAPPGGYGAGIDPYGTWDEKVPAGVQVFPSSITGIPNGSGCTYGSGSCGGVVYGLIDPQTIANGLSVNWTRWAFFVKNFFSRDFYNKELGKGGCLSAFSEGAEAGSILPNLPPGSGVDDMIRQGEQATAVGYQMSKGLTTPLRSSVYRGILEGAENGAGVIAAADYYNQAANGLITEVKSVANGSCH